MATRKTSPPEALVPSNYFHRMFLVMHSVKICYFSASLNMMVPRAQDKNIFK